MEQNKKLETIILDWLQKGGRESAEKARQTQNELDWDRCFIYHELVAELFQCQYEALSDEGKERVAKMFEDSLEGS